MANSQSLTTKAAAVAPERLPCLGPPPLLEGESSVDYDDLLARVSAAVKPTDILEEIFVRDVVDLSWEALRLRRLKAALLESSQHRGIRELSSLFFGYSEMDDIADGWQKREPEVVQRVEKALRSAGLTREHVMAETLSVELDNIERIDRLIASAEARRNAALREVDRHRSAIAQTLRRAIEEPEDAEFEVVENGQPISRDPANAL
jgi:hypothetical protein